MTRPTRTTAPPLALLAILPLASGALAQDAPTAHPAPTLAGPSVENGAKEATLVRRGYDGRLQPLDAPPEIAALDLLGLDARTWEKIDPILAERAAFIDGVVIRNIQTLVEFQAARAAADAGAQRELLAPLIEQLRGLRLRGRLVDQIRDLLPADRQDEYQRLVRERHLAVLDDLRARARSEGAPNPDALAARRFFAASLGQEIKASYDRVVTQSTERLNDLLARLDLDPRTEGEVRRLVTEFGPKTALNPTTEQRRELFAQVYRLLPADARERLVEQLRASGND